MTVAANYRDDYLGTGATADYDFTFEITSKAELSVKQRDISTGVETTLVLDSDFTIPDADVNNADGGTITLTAGVLAAGQRISLRRVLPIVQETDLRNQGAYQAEDVEDAFDRGIKIAQQHQDEIDRSLKLPESELPAATVVIPAKEERASKFLAFDSNGDPVAAESVTGVPATGFGASLIDDATAKEGRQTLGITAGSVATMAALRALTGSDLTGVWYVEGYYAAGDGGGGVFLWVAGSSATENGGTVITPTAGGGRFIRAYSGAVNARWFGAVADGSTHPLSGYFASLAAAQVVYPHAAALTDEIDGVAVQAAINLSRRVYAPAGTYLVNVTIDPTNSNQWVEGDGVNASGGSVLKWNGAVSSTLMKAPGGASRLHGLRFDGGNIAGVTGVKCDDTHRPGYGCWGITRFYQCLAVGFDCSVSNPSGTNGIYYNDFGHMTAEQCGKGVRLATLVAASARVNANSWQHLNAQTCTTGVEINLADGNSWSFLEAEGNDVGVDVVKGNYNCAFGGWLEGNTTWHLRIANNPDVTRFEYHGACTQDSKISYTASNNRTVIIPTQNSYHQYLSGRFFGDNFEARDWGGTNRAQYLPNGVAQTRSAAGYASVDQLSQTVGTGWSFRVSIASDGDTTVFAFDNGPSGGAAVTGGRIGFFQVALSPIAQPASASQAAVTLGNTNSEIGGLTIGAAYSQAEVQALRDKCEELADDVRALSTLLHAIRTAAVDLGLIKGSA